MRAYKVPLLAIAPPSDTGWFIERVFNYEFETQELPSYPTYRQILQNNTASAAHYADGTQVAQQ